MLIMIIKNASSIYQNQCNDDIDSFINGKKKKKLYFFFFFAFYYKKNPF